MTQMEREFGWDDEIVKEGGEGFTLLPPGDYNFTVAKFERGRFAGSEKCLLAIRRKWRSSFILQNMEM